MDNEPLTKTPRVCPHHCKVGPCFTRPAYRDGRRKKAVKVYTIATESTYLLLFGVPSLKLEQNIKDKCKQFGTLERIVNLSDYPDKQIFTDVFLIKFDSVHSARRAKRSLDDSSFYGGLLHVCYAPEYETAAECRIKMHQCRRDNARIARKAEFQYAKRLSSTDGCDASLSYTSVPPTTAISQPDDSIQLANEFVSNTPQQPSYSGDAVDDARNFWLQQGATFMLGSIDSRPCCSTTPTPVVTTSGVLTGTSSLSVSRSTVPLPVQQALSWKPYTIAPDGTTQSTPSISHPQLSLKVAPILDVRKSFVPRCLQTKIPTPSTTRKRKHSDTMFPAKLLTTSKSDMDELNRLAFKLGPQQGPTLPTNGPSKFHTNPKRFVFHRPRRGANNPGEQK